MIYKLTAAPAIATKRFGRGGYSGVVRCEGAHYRSLMAVLPFALLMVQSTETNGVDLSTVAELAVTWVRLYSFLHRPTFTATEVAVWQEQAAAWGGRCCAWLHETDYSDGAYIKNHQLLGGHLADALLEYGACANFDAAPFESRHVTAVKKPARRTSRAVQLAPQLAKRARRAEHMDALEDELSRAAGNSSSNDSDNDDDVAGTAKLSVAAGVFNVVAAERDYRVERLARMTAIALFDAHAGDHVDMPEREGAAAEARVLSLRATRMLRVRLVNDRYAHARAHWRHGQPRYDDVAVHGPEGAVWYARLVAPVAFHFASGRRTELVLVRWYETAPRLLRLPNATRRMHTALSQDYPALQLAPPHRLDWLLPGQLLHQAAMVADPCVPTARIVFANVYLQDLLKTEHERGQRGDVH
jgi:hypothetical protein